MSRDMIPAIEQAFHREFGFYENAVEGSNFSETHFARRWGSVLSEESWSDVEFLESELESFRGRRGYKSFDPSIWSMSSAQQRNSWNSLAALFQFTELCNNHRFRGEAIFISVHDWTFDSCDLYR